MKVKIIRVSDEQSTDAKIVHPKDVSLPSATEGWRFNFRRHSKKTGMHTYILASDDTPEIVEGCLIFQMRSEIEPYMAFVEIAPHNKGRNKKYERVAGCLIAFACRLSFILGKEHYQGWLCFDVMEKNKDDEIKLMALYCKKYGALKFGTTTMVISPQVGENLINTFLK